MPTPAEVQDPVDRPLDSADGAWEDNEATINDPDEKRVLFAALDSFYQYSKVSYYHTTHQRRVAFYALPEAHWKLLAAPPFSYLDTLNAVDAAIESNAALARAILRCGLESFGLPLAPPPPPPPPTGSQRRKKKKAGDDGSNDDDDEDSSNNSNNNWRGFATPNDLDKARSTLRQFYRDWSAEGAAERASCHGPIIADLEAARQASRLAHSTITTTIKTLSSSSSSASSSSPSSPPPRFSVLVPGAGLGRLVFELCRRGFRVEGNEISYHQLLASAYVLNACPRARHHALHPWVHSFSNHASRARHLQAVSVPDVHPGSCLASDDHSGGNNEHGNGSRGNGGNEGAVGGSGGNGGNDVGEMSMSASDFLCLYGDGAHAAAYDAVATVFFIDTAPNVVRYVETVRNCLRPGGVWCNIGPLLWHFDGNSNNNNNNNNNSTANVPRKHNNTGDGTGGRATDLDDGIAEPGSVELTDDEVVLLVEKLGFVIEKRESGIETTYIQNPASMMQNAYRVSHWVARKI